MSPRTGRPKSENPLCHDIKVRVDEQTNTRLLNYAQRRGITRTEVIRQAIDRLLTEEK
ncbi:ribbon-helix-helix protein, CopG family [Clostridiaceae bacterium NSJ-31]|uniref:Ribbon-helix-helix protein, CopG family n=1 Tax=Ligaoa zhengdingensis TaxID=2763658 RepID=A0A926I5U1_9FIRM|nr:ribbon-helix-helix protein, CopG family [Ligaoa zhengdingensis]MBC8547641.1 ribbon-helix-helix protein, CopG family [Ligaoa zhengdingensis]